MTDASTSERSAATPDGRTARAGARLRGHLAAPLYGNAYLLIAGAGFASGLGFVFWTVCARRYTPDAVGLNSALISAMILISGICQLGLNTVIVRYLPGARKASRRLVVVCYVATGAASVAVALVAGLTSSHWSPTLGVLADEGRWLGAFVIGTAAWTIFSLQDSVMTGVRQARWVPIENSLVSGAKIVFAIALVGSMPRGGVFLAWTVPVVLSLLPVNLLIFRRLIPDHEKYAGEPVSWDRSTLVRLAAGNYAGSLFFLASTALLPLLIANQYGAAATAYFFVPWTLAVGLQLVALNMTTSLTVEVAFDESRLREYCERVLAQTFRLVVPATFVVVVAAPYILRVFGHEYAAEGTTLLRLLALATVPNVIVALGLSVARIQHSGRMVLWTQGALCVSTLGLSLALLPPLGIDGVGLAVLVSQTMVAAWLALGMLRPILLKGRRASSTRRRGGTEQ